MGIDLNEYGYITVEDDDYFSFDCSGCGDCCRNIKDSVMAESLDLYRLARFFGIEMSEVISRYMETAFLAWWFPVFTLKTKQNLDTCVFLKTSRCCVNSSKPRACRVYPLGVGPDDEKQGAWMSFIVSKKQHHFTGQRRLVSDWMDENFTPEDRAFVAADYQHTAELASLVKKIGKCHEDEVVKLVLLFRYISYDMSEDFLPQYNRNMKVLKRQLEALARKKGGSNAI